MRKRNEPRTMAARFAGWSLLELLLYTILVTALAGIGVSLAVRQERMARVSETVSIVNAMRAQAMMGAVLFAEEDATGADRRFDASNFVGGAMPTWLMENATTYRNPIGIGEFQGYSVITSAGEQQYAFWFWNLPRWACADLAVALAPSGFVFRGVVLNRNAVGQRVPISATMLANQCRSDLPGTVPSLLLVGPAPN